jgi:hypothetical protein
VRAVGSLIFAHDQLTGVCSPAADHETPPWGPQSRQALLVGENGDPIEFVQSS